MPRSLLIIAAACSLAANPSRASETVGTMLVWSGSYFTISAPPDKRTTSFFLDEDCLWNVDHKPDIGGRVRVVWETRGTRNYCTFLEAAGSSGGKKDFLFRRGETGKLSFLGHITRRKGNAVSFEALSGTVYQMTADSSTDFSGFPTDSYAIPMVRIYYTLKGKGYHVVKFETL